MLDAATERVPLVLGQHERLVSIVAARDHDEMRAVEVDVSLQAVVRVPVDLALAADGGDEAVVSTSVGSSIVESVYFCHAWPPCGGVAERYRSFGQLYRRRFVTYRNSGPAT
jgi:hypothetical protein